MNIFLDASLKFAYSPCFRQGTSMPLQECLRAANGLIDSWVSIPIDTFTRVPHAVTSIYYVKDNFYVDIEDSYEEEEDLLAPPEARIFPSWRRDPARVTHMAVLFMYALLKGDFPDIHEPVSLPYNVIRDFPEDIVEPLQQLIEMGLAEDPQNRFQSLEQLQRSLQWLEARVSSIAQGNSNQVTQKFLPKMQRFSPSRKRTTTVFPMQNKQQPVVYELQIWNPKYEEAHSVYVRTPCNIIIGRKISEIESMDQRITKVWETKEEKDGINYYTLLVEKDRCLSRQHLRLFISPESRTIKDLGSTHGVIVFADRIRDVDNCRQLSTFEEINFLSPEEQHVQIANTHIRIRPR